MARKVRWWLLGWALLGAPALIYVAGQLEHVTGSAARASWIVFSSIALPGFSIGSGVLAVASLGLPRAGVRLAVVCIYAMVLYAFTLAFDNLPYATHAVLLPMPAPVP